MGNTEPNVHSYVLPANSARINPIIRFYAVKQQLMLQLPPQTILLLVMIQAKDQEVPREGITSQRKLKKVIVTTISKVLLMQTEETLITQEKDQTSPYLLRDFCCSFRHFILCPSHLLQMRPLKLSVVVISKMTGLVNHLYCSVVHR